MEKSRFKSHLQRKAFKNALIALCGILLIILILSLFGTNLLISFSLLVGKLTGNPTETTNIPPKSAQYIAPPTLDPLKDATNNESIVIQGSATPHQKVKLYLNSRLIDTTTVKSDKSFTFSSITLQKGENTLKAKAFTEDNIQSEYSNEIKISLLKDAPSLDISNPTDGQTYKKEESPIRVTGKTDSGVKVTINDFRAIVDDEGNYSYLYTLQDGDNNLKIEATDNAGNKTTKEIKIKTE